VAFVAALGLLWLNGAPALLSLGFAAGAVIYQVVRSRSVAQVLRSRSVAQVLRNKSVAQVLRNKSVAQVLRNRSAKISSPASIEPVSAAPSPNTKPAVCVAES
jgi:hypothetical protein